MAPSPRATGEDVTERVDEIVDVGATSQVHEAAPFSRLLGFEVLELSPDHVRARVAWQRDRLTTGSGLHGGALMSLADICGGTIAFLNVPSGANGTSTIESKTNFFRPLREGHAWASARIVHKGRRTIVVETEVRDDAERLVSKTTQTEAILSGR